MTIRRRIGSSDLDVYPLSLGCNTFGWTADEATSHEVLDAYVAAGGNFLDTADGYPAFVPGRPPGLSEEFIGSWLPGRSDRDELVIATKVSRHPDFRGLAPQNVRAAADASLGRMGLDRIDLYYAHYDDPEVPIADIAGAFSGLVDAGKVRWIGISNFSPARIDEWLETATAEGLHEPVALEPHYNLVERDYELAQRPSAQRFGLGVMPYYALARGFLTGKYRPGTEVRSERAGGERARAAGASDYLTPDGIDLLQALDEVAAAHGASVASVSLAWLAAQPTVVAPIASVRLVSQLADLVASVGLELTPDDLDRLSTAGASLDV
ncbi:MAG: alcohol dehydrogenase [Micrococcales bacterium 73-13]|nr:MAG: alcohol dehydrogenase [Micrococcales bacterium 73-13]